MKIVNTIIAEWWLIGFFFTLGGVWWQGKAWFNGVNKKLEDTATAHAEQNKLLVELSSTVSTIHGRVERMDQVLQKIHEEVHDQEVKLAVLESTTAPRRTRKSAAK